MQQIVHFSLSTRLTVIMHVMHMKLHAWSILATAFAFPVVNAHPYGDGSYTFRSFSVGHEYKTPCLIAPNHCWEQDGSLLSIEDGYCYEPLNDQKNPCGPFYWFTLSVATSAASEKLVGSCVPRRCWPGYYVYKGRCMTLYHAKYEKCRGGPLYVDLDGDIHCGYFPGWKTLIENALPCVILGPQTDDGGILSNSFSAVSGLSGPHDDDGFMVSEALYQHTNINEPLDIDYEY